MNSKTEITGIPGSGTGGGKNTLLLSLLFWVMASLWLISEIEEMSRVGAGESGGMVSKWALGVLGVDKASTCKTPPPAPLALPKSVISIVTKSSFFVFFGFCGVMSIATSSASFLFVSGCASVLLTLLLLSLLALWRSFLKEVGVRKACEGEGEAGIGDRVEGEANVSFPG